MIILLKGVAMKKKIRNSIIVIFISTVFFALGCSSPKYDFYDSIRNQNIEGISKYYGKIDPTEQESSMKKGLSIACTKGDKGVLDSLINLGGKLDSCDFLIDSIDKNNDFNFIVYVYEKSDRDQECINRSMQKAVSLYRKDIIKFLLEKGANVDTATKDGETALHQAVTRNDLSLTSDLLKKNADVNAQKKAYKLEMIIPYEKGYQASFKYSETGTSPLFVSVQKYINDKNDTQEKYLEIIKLLLAGNANPNLIVTGYTCVYKDPMGNDPWSENSFGVSAGFEGGSYWRSTSGGRFIEFGNKVKGNFHRAERKDNTMIITDNFDNSNSVLSCYFSKTASHLAAENNETKLLDLLKKYGADYSIKDFNGKTVMELMKQKQ